MRTFFVGEPFPQEITCTLFLMGPSAQGTHAAAPSWRREALGMLDSFGFSGEVFVPELRKGACGIETCAQASWEEAAQHQSDRILVWLPGTAANDEWGYWKSRDPARLILGVPPDTPHVRCPQLAAEKLGIPHFSTLEETCRAAVADRGELRCRGECQVPLHIWRTAAFQAWHAAQRLAGNVLHQARVEWVFRVKPHIVFYWALHVDVYVTAEARHKSNEVILGRPDLAAVLLYRAGRDLMETEVVLVREFRSPARTADGCIWELPSGSSLSPDRSVEVTATREVMEELGLAIKPHLLYRHGARQISGPLSVHLADLLSLEMSAGQIAALREQETRDTALGDPEQSEITRVRVRTVRQILSDGSVDWSTIGMVLAALNQRLGAAT